MAKLNTANDLDQFFPSANDIPEGIPLSTDESIQLSNFLNKTNRNLSMQGRVEQRQSELPKIDMPSDEEVNKAFEIYGQGATGDRADFLRDALRSSMTQQRIQDVLGRQKAESDYNLASSAAGSQRRLLEQANAQLQPFNEFKPPKESMGQVAGFQAAMMLFAGLIGGKGAYGGMAALNAAGGMMKGYADGQKEVFEKAKQEFEENMRVVQANNSRVMQILKNNMEISKLDIAKGTAKAERDLKIEGYDLMADAVKRGGLSQTFMMMNRLNTDMKPALELFDKLSGNTGNIENWIVKKEDGSIEQVSMTQEQAKKRIANGETVLKSGPVSSRYGSPLSGDDLEDAAQGVANYQVDVTRYGVAQRAEIIKRAREINPNYNQGEFQNRNIAYRNWIQSNSAGAKQIASFATVDQHLDVLEDLGLALKNRDTRLANQSINFLKKEFGDENVTDFDTAKQIVAAEVIKTIVNNGGTGTERKEAETAFSSAGSPAQIKGAIETARKLIAGRMNVSKQQFINGTGRSEEDFNKLLPPSVQQNFSKYLRNTNRPIPSQADIDYARKHPEVRQKFIERFGVEP